MLEKSFAERSFVEKCWRKVFERLVVQAKCWRKTVLVGVKNQHLCVCVCVSTSLGRCFCCIAGATLVATLQLLRHRWRSNLYSGSWVVHLCMLQTMMQHLSRHAVVYCILHLLPPTETRQKQGSAYPGASAIPGAPEVSSFAGPSAGSWDLYSI